MGMVMYCTDYDDVYPAAQGTKAAHYVVYPYVRSKEAFKTTNPANTEFRFNINLAGVNSNSLEDPSSTPMFYESAPWEDGRRLVAFADGTVKFVPAEEWPEIGAALQRKYPRKTRFFPMDYGMDFDPEAE